MKPGRQSVVELGLESRPSWCLSRVGFQNHVALLVVLLSPLPEASLPPGIPCKSVEGLHWQPGSEREGDLVGRMG